MDTPDLTQSQIDDLVARYPLPDGVGDCVMNREELADALATSMNTITAWINAGMPVQQTGGQGKPYELRLAHCWAWRQSKKADEDLRSAEVKSAQAALRLALVGGVAGDSIEALDPKARREILAVQIEHERFSAQRKQLMRRADVAEMLDQIFAMVRDTMEAAPDRVERIEAMPPKAVQAFIGICDATIDELRGRIDKFWLDHREVTIAEKRDLFDA
ncbi:terminase small subunit [Mesorhizobium sp. B1-1-2]|uniref:terminase small subunit n=1 Tax=Mesorhizobium sp. B1-1-2 TaxID=2589982 RepID=UPI001127AA3D|nr:terminase small subunit [Mesorhizobium sp. B1-1-2]TPN79974.1 terminase small subunit [Mesorhizobium sp. B1-1-2]